MLNLRAHTPLGLLYVDMPPLAASLVIAELFYKFGSFSLEAVGFLATWAVVSVLYTALLRLVAAVTPLPAPEQFRTAA
jgi:hypothetical protein